MIFIRIKNKFSNIKEKASSPLKSMKCVDHSLTPTDFGSTEPANTISVPHMVGISGDISENGTIPHKTLGFRSTIFPL